MANVFYRLELIEAYGTGIRKIMEAYEGSARKPKIEVTENAFKITIPNRNISNASDEETEDQKESVEQEKKSDETCKKKTDQSAEKRLREYWELVNPLVDVC